MTFLKFNLLHLFFFKIFKTTEVFNIVFDLQVDNKLDTNQMIAESLRLISSRFYVIAGSSLMLNGDWDYL